MLERLGSLSAARPRRTLLIVLAFVVLAGVVGGPIAGKLEADGGFATEASESSRAYAQIQRATGVDTSPGIVVLAPEARAAAVEDRLAGIDGVASTTPPVISGDRALVTATLTARA